MAIQSTHRATIFRCDREGCAAHHTTPYKNFKLAVEHAKAAGWVMAPVLDDVGKPKAWKHYCSWIHRPSS